MLPFCIAYIVTLCARCFHVLCKCHELLIILFTDSDINFFSAAPSKHGSNFIRSPGFTAHNKPAEVMTFFRFMGGGGGGGGGGGN